MTVSRRLVATFAIVLFAYLGAPVWASENEPRSATAEWERHEFAFGIAATRWSDLKDLEPQPVDPIAVASGGFAETGFGFEIAYRYRLGGAAPHWSVGGEFVGILHMNEDELTTWNAATGEASSIELMANWGQLTGGLRYSWRPDKTPEIVAGAGVGLYLLRIKESLEDFGVADRSESDSTVGGYATAGLRFPIGKGRFGVRLDGRINFVSFDDFGETFAGQSLDGPVPSLVIGMDYRF